jgi:hypothetical protein
MSIRHRLQRLEAAVTKKEQFRGRREVFFWEPTNTEATAFVNEQTFNTPHRQRRYEIHIVGEPPQSVYNKLAKEILPDLETLKKMTDAQLQTCQEKYLEATLMALNASRKKQGLPSVFV